MFAKNIAQCNILPLNAVLGLLLNKSNTFKNVCDIIYPSFLPDGQLISSLNVPPHHKPKLSISTLTCHTF